MAEITGSEIIARCLQKEGIKDLFYIMGGPMLLAEATCIKEGIRMIDVRHEQAAAFMCQAYSRLKQVPSVCMAASGPGVTNLITGMANALVDCCPVVALGGSQPIVAVRSPGVPGDRPGRTDARLLQVCRPADQPQADSATDQLRAAKGDERESRVRSISIARATCCTRRSTRTWWTGRSPAARFSTAARWATRGRSMR